MTNTSEVDEVCFVKALEDVYALGEIDPDWAAYPHTCDSGIIRDLFQERFNRLPEAAELLRFKQRFVELLSECHLADSSRFAAIAGAAAALERLKGESGWAVALASGSWRASALMKLQAAEIRTDGIPSAFADDGIAREEIVQAAIERALSHHVQDEFEKIISIGDAVWDVRAAGNLKIAFLGIGSAEDAARLRKAGAKQVIDDFTDYDRLMQSLYKAEIPEA